MRERTAATVTALALAGFLLINFKAPDDKSLVTSIRAGSSGTSAGSGSTTAGAGSTTGGTGSTTAGSNGTSTGTTGGSTTGSSGGTSSTATGTYTGPVVSDPYGDVQVQITVAKGKITDVQALSLPTGGHSGRISDFAAPILRTQALTAQSANIDGVSGATYTSQAYAQSLQGALDAAGI